MRLAGLFQFYLPYVLPRDADWAGRTLTTAIDALEVNLRVRGPAEPLFPNEIDQTLASMSLQLQRISLPSSSISRAVRDMAIDRIEATVLGDANLAVESPEAVEMMFLTGAVEVTNNLLQHCRVLARAPFLSGLGEHYRSQDGLHYFLFPRSVTWFDANGNQPFRLYGAVNASCASGAIRSPEQGSVSFAALERALRGGAPDLPVSLLVDAEERVTTLRLREAILSLGMACEVASNSYISRHSMDSDATVRRILGSRFSFAKKRLHDIPLHVSGRSLQVSDQTTFREIERLYRARNSVAHRATLTFDDAGTQEHVDLAMATTFLQAARTAIAWIESL